MNVFWTAAKVAIVRLCANCAARLPITTVDAAVGDGNVVPTQRETKNHIIVQAFIVGFSKYSKNSGKT
jgi:hypothetical protein